MGFLGTIGKWFGRKGRDTGRALAKLWHSLSPYVNKAFKKALSEVGPIGWAIIKNIVASVEKAPKGSDKLDLAKKEIKSGFEKAKIEYKNWAVNFLIEFAVSLLP